MSICAPPCQALVPVGPVRAPQTRAGDATGYDGVPGVWGAIDGGAGRLAAVALR